ncbi:MAG TPA: hypothetical protein DCY57_04475 [Bacteroidetes bacterium]|nr:hypothetical protein [Bacteroidota bacterium]
MKRSVLLLLGILLIVLGVVSIGALKREIRISTNVTVSKSEATSFRVLSSAEQISSWMEGITLQETLVEHPENVGSRYRLTQVDGSEWEATVLDLEDNRRIVMLLTDPRAEIHIEVELFPSPEGTRVQIDTITRGSTVFYRTLMPFAKRSILKSQMRINEHWKRLIETSIESLVGEWSGTDASGSEQLFEFHFDGTADWKVSSSAGEFQLKNLLYRRNTLSQPQQLDLTGFQKGPLAGMTLFGIVDLSRQDTLIYDAAAGKPDDASARPETFSESATVYIRIR